MFLSTSITAVAPIENVQKLRFEIEPLWVYAQSDYERGRGEDRPFLTFTAEDGTNRVYNPDRDAKSCTQDVGQGRYDCRLWDTRFITLIDTLAPIPLPTLFLSRNDRFIDIALTYDYMAISAMPLTTGTRADFRGAYLVLSDGRECPITMRRLGPKHPIVPTFVFADRENWHIKLEIDFSGTVIDPVQCGVRPYEIVWNVRSATAERVEGML